MSHGDLTASSGHPLGGVAGPKRGQPLTSRIVLVVGAWVVTGCFYLWLSSIETQNLQHEFDQLASREVAILETRLDSMVSSLNALRNLYVSTDEVDGADFEEFAAGLERISGLQVFAWAPRVSLSQRAEFESQAIAEGVSDYAIRDRRHGALAPADPHNEYFPLRFVWPRKGNERALGFDIGSETIRRKAIDRAIDSDECAMTGPIDLVQETGTQRGLLIIYPIYQPGSRHTTVEERRRNLKGLVTVAVRMGDFFAGALKVSRSASGALNASRTALTGASAVDLSIRDSAVAPKFGLYHQEISVERANLRTLSHIDPRLTYQHIWKRGGRTFEIEAKPGKSFAAIHSSGMLGPALGTLLIVNALVVLVVSVVYRNRDMRDSHSRLLLDAEVQKREASEVANAAKNSFLAVVSHELRTPMNGIIGMVDVLMQTSLLPSQVEMSQTIRTSALTLLSIISEILDFSKIESGKFEVATRPMCIAEVVRNSCVMLENAASRRNVDLTFYTDPRLPLRSVSDPIRLQQVLVNLIGNAIKFSNVLDRAGRIAVRATMAMQDDQATWVELSVRDNGIGMSQEVQDKLFLPFQQADSGTTRQHSGTGLGLAISQRISILLGGEIRVESATGVGSTFTVRIPLGRMSQSEVGPSLVAGLTVMVIGKDDELIADLESQLRFAGATVVVATDITTSMTADVCVWMVNRQDGLTLESIRDAIRLYAKRINDPRRQFIVKLFGMGGRPNYSSPEMLQVDGNSVTQSSFLRAVAVLAGRADEFAIDDSAPVRDTSRIDPLSVEASGRIGRVASSKLVLVAEDNEINQDVIRRQLSLLGVSAEIVENGAIALERWRLGDFALLITDLQMPKVDGYQLAKAIRDHEAIAKRRAIPIIALTANAMKGVDERCKAVGMNDFLSKPVLLSDLRSMLERWLLADTVSE